MRRFLVIVILSYFTAYYYLDSTYWTNPNKQLNSAVNISEPEKINNEADPASPDAYITSKSSTDLALLRK